MAWQSLIVDTDAQHAELLGDALLEGGALSVDLLDADADTPDEEPIFGEPGEPAPGLWRHNRVCALFDADADATGILQKAASAIGLAPAPAYRLESLPNNDWVRLTQSQFEPIQISRRLWIVPSWHEPSDSSAINIMLDPGLAFGTGSHPTTRLCLRWLDEHMQESLSVLDYGCGSGILAIAALKLGASAATGVDLDNQAVASSQDNARANCVENAMFFLPDAAPKKKYDLVIANILTNPLRLLAPLLADATKTGGQIVLSGILEAQAEDLMNLYRQWFEFDAPVFEEGWSRLCGRKR